jgi:hypothetical protein
MPREPGLYLWMLMGGVVVDDTVNNPAGWHRALDGIEKADELLMAGNCPSPLECRRAKAAIAIG